MKIQKYFDDINITGNYDKLKPGPFYQNTISKFYKDFIKPHAEELFCNHESDLISFCEKIEEYLKSANPIYWIRKWEAGSGGNVNDNRRTALTEVIDNNNNVLAYYVYISNFDAQEIYNMILKGVCFDDFEKLMISGQYKFHRDSGQGSIESTLTAYQLLQSAQSLGVMNRANLYLAHIHDVNKNFSKKVDYEFEKGAVNDWHDVNNILKFPNPVKIKESKTKISKNDINEYLKACFLRFISPFNYFLVPGINYEVNAFAGKKNISIGENKKLTTYVQCKLFEDFIKGKRQLEQHYQYFEDNILLPNNEKAANLLSNYKNFGQEKIHIVYGNTVGEEGKLLMQLDDYIKNRNNLPNIFKNYSYNTNQIIFKNKNEEFKYAPNLFVNYCDFLKKILNKIKDKNRNTTVVDKYDIRIGSSAKSNTNKQPATPKKHNNGSQSKTTGRVDISFLPSNTSKFIAKFQKIGYATVTIMLNDGTKEIKRWNCKKLNNNSNLRGNLISKSWYRKNKSLYQKIVCEVK